jgi:hypothetical protein
MPLTFLLALQAAAAPAPAFVDLDFDLARYDRAEFGLDGNACHRGDPSAIVVCGRRHGGGAYPLAQMARIFEPGRIVAVARLGGGWIGDVRVEQ